jgi:hypothetical protein
MFLKFSQKKIDFKSNKWTLLSWARRDWLSRKTPQSDKKNSTHSKKFAKVEVGIAGGSKLFTVPFSTVQFYNLEKYAKPLVGRSVQVPSNLYNKKIG